MALEIVKETADYQLVQDRDPNTDAVSGQRLIWKPGSPMANAQDLEQKLIAARATLRDNYANWPNMTAAQKDTANRQAQRAVANLMGQVLHDLSSAGD